MSRFFNLPAILLLFEAVLFAASGSAVEKAGFVFERAPFPSCHASTIAETTGGQLVAAWFGGKDEGEPDVDIWISRWDGDHWSVPVDVADGRSEGGAGSAGIRYPCWNPVLFQIPGGDLLLFYKVGPSPREWWGMMKSSADEGASWLEVKRLPDDILGPIKNKPIDLGDGRMLAGSSTEDLKAGWQVHLEHLDVRSGNWSRVGPLNDGVKVAAIQPTLLTYPEGRLQMLCRDRRPSGRVLQAWSKDSGRSWTALEETGLPNPNSGLDAVSLKDGRQLLVYNHSFRAEGSPRDRETLNLSLSRDGLHWEAALLLEHQAGEEFSYPAVIQARDGRVHVTYTWKRLRIRHLVIDPARLTGTPIQDGRWPWESIHTPVVEMP